MGRAYWGVMVIRIASNLFWGQSTPEPRNSRLKEGFFGMDIEPLNWTASHQQSQIHRGRWGSYGKCAKL